MRGEPWCRPILPPSIYPPIPMRPSLSILGSPCMILPRIYQGCRASALHLYYMSLLCFPHLFLPSHCPALPRLVVGDAAWSFYPLIIRWRMGGHRGLFCPNPLTSPPSSYSLIPPFPDLLLPLCFLIAILNRTHIPPLPALVYPLIPVCSHSSYLPLLSSLQCPLVAWGCHLVSPGIF